MPDQQLSSTISGHDDEGIDFYEELGSDSESDVQSVTSELYHRQTTELRLEQNREYFDSNISELTLEQCNLECEDANNIRLIKQPTASKMSHRLLNPYIYRNLQDVGTLDDLAVLLDSPSNWLEYYDLVSSNQVIQYSFINFRTLPDNTSEASIRIKFLSLVTQVSMILGADIHVDCGTKFTVGGILSRNEYDLRGNADVNFFDTKRRLLATTIKKSSEFHGDDMWYHGDRGIQMVSTMFCLNSPVLLLSQKHWKLIVENRDRNAIMTYPVAYDERFSKFVNSSAVHHMSRDLLKVVTICLLSKRTSTATPMFISGHKNNIPQCTDVRVGIF